MVLLRYVLREHVTPFLFSFAVIMFLLVIDLVLQMLDRILGKGLSPVVILELFLLNTAWMVALAVPMAVLVSTLMAFGRLSADHEITAMKALGIGAHQVVWPVLLAGGVLGGLLVLFNDRVLPEFNHRARLLMMDIHRKRPAVAFGGKAGIFIQDFRNFRILFGSSDPVTGVLRDVLVYQYDRGAYPVTIVAEAGEVRFLERQDEAFLLVYRGEIHRVDEKDPDVYVRTTFEKLRVRLGDAGRQLSRSVSTYRNDREMSVGMMLARVTQYEQEMRQISGGLGQQLSAFFQAVLLDAPDAQRETPLGLKGALGRVLADTRVLHHKQRASDRLWVEIHKKYSISMACLVFILVGAPLGIRVRGSSPAIGAGISIGFFLIWWVCLIGGEKLADRGLVAPWLAMWSPNLLTALIGIGLFLRLVLENRLRVKRRMLCES